MISKTFRAFIILIILSETTLGQNYNIFFKFMPALKYSYQYRQHPNSVLKYNNFVPLYINSGPDPVHDYMANHFQPRMMVKRFRNRRMKRDLNNQDLLDSFGGQPETATTKTEIITPTPKSGFYFLLDWNSFLEVDNLNGKRVNVKIQPKFGDPKRFLNVSVK
ncbi:unnamed protein product [Ceutorhynchus assimilis]|uniref:Uncharacterized protein n=1 Tax=Ceutorhynchus assimilis TaxID=467358 RepID=A0A9P0DGS7_9CUCU|nr:unnamed protein product [Ceutorhynchus assimilis]